MIVNFSYFPIFLNLLSVSMDLPILDISYKGHHTICDLLCLTSFTEHNVFKVHPVVACVS